MSTKCPYCAEEIKPEAIVCRYCKRDLTFYTPIAARLAALEDRVSSVERTVTDLLKPALNEQLRSPGVARPKPLFYVVALLVGTAFSTVCYDFYLRTDGAELFALWLSILTPLFIGLWIGLVTANRTVGSYFAVGLGAGLLNSLGVYISLRYDLEPGQAVDWRAVLRLYFLTPFFLITFGGLLGDWFRRWRSGGTDSPSYARNLAQAVIRAGNAEGQEGSQQVELAQKWIAALTPLLTAIGSIVGAWLTYLAATRP